MNQHSDDFPLVEKVLKLFYKTSTPEAVIVLDASGRVVGWARGSETLLGYAPDEVIGDSLEKIFTPEDRQKGIHRYEMEVAHSDGYSEDDRWHLRKDDTRIWVTGTLTSIRSDQGNLLGYVKIMRDRTDLRTQLERGESDNAALRDRAHQSELFLHTLGHELRNPLGPLALAVQLLSSVEMPAGSAKAVQVIKRQITVLQGLAEDLMDVARNARSGFELAFERVHLQKLLTDVVDDLQEPAGKKKISLTAFVQDAPIYLDADPRRLAQVFLNLIGNALKYTPAEGSVVVKVVEEVDEAVVRVEDTGIGISPEMLPRIFEFFTQDAGAKKVAPGGLGVGLGLVKQIVELHQGTAAARSAGLGKGSEFLIRLPMPDAPRLKKV